MQQLGPTVTKAAQHCTMRKQLLSKLYYGKIAASAKRSFGFYMFGWLSTFFIAGTFQKHNQAHSKSKMEFMPIDKVKMHRDKTIIIK